jgi:hypothetical protein
MFFVGDIQCRPAIETSARVCASAEQQFEAFGVVVLGGNVNRRNAVVVALIDVAASTTTYNLLIKRGA